MTKTRVKTFLPAIALAGLVLGLVIGQSNWQPVAPGLPDAGPIITWLNQISKLAFTFIGLIIFGKLISVTFISRPENLRQVQSQLSILANGWAVIALVVAVTQMSYVLGLSAQETFAPGVLSTYLFDLTSSRGYVISAVIALLIAILIVFIKSDNSLVLVLILSAAAIATPLLNSHAASLGDHSMALTSSIAHGISMSAWVGTLIAIIPLVKANDKQAVIRFGSLAKWSVLVLVISGTAAAYTRLDSISDFWLTGYGQLVVIKVSLFLIAIYFANKIRIRLTENLSVAKFVSFELLFLGLAIGFGVALQNTALSRESIALPTAAEEVLGYEFPPPPSLANYIFGWQPEWVLLTATIVGASLYLSAVVKLARNGIKWPIGRTISFLIAAKLLIWTSSGGISKYAMISFSAHMIQHMTLSMIAPIFLVLSAPITLLLRSLPTHNEPGTKNAREWILGLLNSTYAKIITHPIIVLIIFTFGLYGLYFTPLFADLMRSHSGHVFMEIHFLFSGFLFAFMTVGVDPAPRQIPYWSKLMMVLVALGLHTFFALAIMQSTTPIGQDWYAQVQPPWIYDLLRDNYEGGGIAWAIGEIPTLILAIIVAVQWARSDSRLAARKDRAAQRDGDSELKAYNERLAKLNQFDQQN